MQTKQIVGVDEAGRGALIGNVVAAAVILPSEYDSLFMVDSKTLTEQKRKVAAEYIKSVALDCAIGVASPREIDALNIHYATLLAMQRAIDAIDSDFDEVWIDGKFAPKTDKPAFAFVKGDQLYDCIGAASILAKTYRDAELCELHKKYPEYGLASHKGYPTKRHRQAIEQFGILPEHRRSYKIIKSR
ncbi:MAG: ribonuclease HII [Gammaproteobacteria bacterium]|nr:MAG: ribonuclease HII [Gammaproteobacteria bacterium]